MKSIIYFHLILLLPHFGLAQSKEQIWTSTDREYLLSGLKTTESNFLQEVRDLTNEQLHFKPDSSQWSISEVMEHLGVYEELLYWDLLNNQYTEERPDLVDAVTGIDSIMVAYSTDPNKGQAPFVAQPIGRFKEKVDLINYFTRFRKEVITLVQDTDVDFRLHFIFRPADWGVWHIRDLHQYTLLWIAHTDRHLNQIKRIKSNPGFPE